MANRHLARSIVMQSLYEWDFYSKNTSKVPEILARNLKEYGLGLKQEDQDFTTFLTEGVIKKQATLDTIIEKAAHDWPMRQTPIVDRNVLRIGLYELLFAPKSEVPARVAINEAIELGKQFGGEHSGKFVNGVLGTIYKEMGEPGKDDEPKKKRKHKKPSSDELSKLPIDRKSGAVVFYKDKKGQISLALVHDIFGYWTLSKGTVEEKDTNENTARKKAHEEMNLSVVVKELLGANEYLAHDPERGQVRKQVTYFLAEADSKDSIKLMKEGGLDSTRWFSVSDISELKIYPDIRPIIEKGLAKISNSK